MKTKSFNAFQTLIVQCLALISDYDKLVNVSALTTESESASCPKGQLSGELNNYSIKRTKPLGRGGQGVVCLASIVGTDDKEKV